MDGPDCLESLQNREMRWTGMNPAGAEAADAVVRKYGSGDTIVDTTSLVYMQGLQPERRMKASCRYLTDGGGGRDLAQALRTRT